MKALCLVCLCVFLCLNTSAHSGEKAGIVWIPFNDAFDLRVPIETQLSRIFLLHNTNANTQNPYSVFHISSKNFKMLDKKTSIEKFQEELNNTLDNLTHTSDGIGQDTLYIAIDSHGLPGELSHENGVLYPLSLLMKILLETTQKYEEKTNHTVLIKLFYNACYSLSILDAIPKDTQHLEVYTSSAANKPTFVGVFWEAIESIANLNREKYGCNLFQKCDLIHAPDFFSVQDADFFSVLQEKNFHHIWQSFDLTSPTQNKKPLNFTDLLFLLKNNYELSNSYNLFSLIQEMMNRNDTTIEYARTLLISLSKLNENNIDDMELRELLLSALKKSGYLFIHAISEKSSFILNTNQLYLKVTLIHLLYDTIKENPQALKQCSNQVKANLKQILQKISTEHPLQYSGYEASHILHTAPEIALMLLDYKDEVSFLIEAL